LLACSSRNLNILLFVFYSLCISGLMVFTNDNKLSKAMSSAK
jgi:hypothetical protein